MQFVLHFLQLCGYMFRKPHDTPPRRSGKETEMATAYDTWKLDNGIDEAEEARAEAIAERTDELTAERMADEKRVHLAICDALNGDGDLAIPEMLGRFFMAFDAAQTDDRMADAGNSLFRDLYQFVEPLIRRDAEIDATAEQDRREGDAEEARSYSRRAAA